MDEQNSSDFDFRYVFIVNGVKTTGKGKRSYTVGIFSQVHYAVYIAEQEVNFYKGDLICNVMKMPLDNVIQKEEQVKIVYSAKFEDLSEREEFDFDWEATTKNTQNNREPELD
jgi:hypothetical protein